MKSKLVADGATKCNKLNLSRLKTLLVFNMTENGLISFMKKTQNISQKKGVLTSVTTSQKVVILFSVILTQTIQLADSPTEVHPC